MFTRQIQSTVNEGRLVVPQMQIDNNHFPVHTVEFQNPKVLIRPSQAKSTKGKNVVIGEPRSEQKKKSLEASSKNSTLGWQDQKKGARSVQTGLTGLVTGLTGPSGGSVLGGHEQRKKDGSTQTGHSESSGKNSRNDKKKGPSFKQLLGKYEEKGATQRQKKRPDQVKDTNPSTEHREQSASHVQQGNNTFAPY